MKTTVKRLLALLCAVAVGAATMASCKKDTVDQTSSDEYEIEYIYETESGDETASGEVDATSNGDNSSKNNPSKNNPSKNNSSTPGVIKQSGSYHKWDYSAYKGKTVSFAMWSDFV